MADDEVVDLLASVDLFRELSKRHRRDLAERGKIVTHRAGAAVTEEGGVAVGFHLLLDGTATVKVGGAAKRNLQKGDFFGEISLVDGQPRSATVEAGPGLRTFCLTTWEFRPLLEEQPHLALGLLTAMCGRLREAEAVQPAS
jgi:CRP-like cAMP-binding protein